MEAKVATLNDRCATLQRENEQNERNLEELDTQHQQVVGEAQALTAMAFRGHFCGVRN